MIEDYHFLYVVGSDHRWEMQTDVGFLGPWAFWTFALAEHIFAIFVNCFGLCIF